MDKKEAENCKEKSMKPNKARINELYVAIHEQITGL